MDSGIRDPGLVSRPSRIPRIALDVSSAVHRRAGMGRYAQELAAALQAVDAGREYTLFYNRAAEARVEAPLDRLPRLALELRDRPWRLRVALAYLTRVAQDRLLPGVDLFHATDHLLPHLTRVQSVFTLHDLAFRFYPETHTPLNRWFLTLLMPRFLRAADRVIADSAATARDAARFYGLDAARAKVIYPGVSARFRPAGPEGVAAVRAQYDLPERFILSVGTVEPRKNLSALLEAYLALRSQETAAALVIVGKRGWRSEPFFRRLRELGLEDQVVFPGFVADEDLPALYSAASLLAFPSLYEGFGLPVLEAMACGTPVVCSNASSLPEVAGDSALLLPPGDIGALTEAIRRVLVDDDLRARLRAGGPGRAGRFTWENAARRTAEVYAELGCR